MSSWLPVAIIYIYIQQIGLQLCQFSVSGLISTLFLVYLSSDLEGWLNLRMGMDLRIDRDATSGWRLASLARLVKIKLKTHWHRFHDISFMCSPCSCVPGSLCQRKVHTNMKKLINRTRHLCSNIKLDQLLSAYFYELYMTGFTQD